ncbi:hypothetical protein YC2023_062321 [Brassica napus]
MKIGSFSLNRAVGESPHETSSSHVERSYWLMRRALSTEKVVDTRESPHFLLSPKKLGFATREAIFVATPIQSSILHQIDDVVRSHRAERHGNEAAFDQIDRILDARKKISQQKLLDRLLSKNDTDLSPNEISLKNKLISELLD